MGAFACIVPRGLRSFPARFQKKPCFPFTGPGGAGAADLVSLPPSVLREIRAKNQQVRALGVRGRFSSSGGAAPSVPMAGGAFRFSADRGGVFAGVLHPVGPGVAGVIFPPGVEVIKR